MFERTKVGAQMQVEFTVTSLAGHWQISLAASKMNVGKQTQEPLMICCGFQMIRVWNGLISAKLC